MARTKAKAVKKPPVTADEKAKIRALKIVGHDSLLTKDEYGRDRVAGSAVSGRQYDIGTQKAVVRVRNVDPLAGIASLTWQQRKAGLSYRDDYEICDREGIKPVSWDIRVDGSGAGKTMPERISDAHANLASANEAMGYGQIALIVERVCGQGMSISELSRASGLLRDSIFSPQRLIANTPMRRESISLLLQMGLEKLAVHYGIVSPSKRVDR